MLLDIPWGMCPQRSEIQARHFQEECICSVSAFDMEQFVKRTMVMQLHQNSERFSDTRLSIKYTKWTKLAL